MIYFFLFISESILSSISDFAIFKALLGTQVADATNGAFGAWNLYIGAVLLAIFSILVALTSRIKFNDFIEAYGEGFRKISKSYK